MLPSLARQSDPCGREYCYKLSGEVARRSHLGTNTLSPMVNQLHVAISSLITNDSKIMTVPLPRTLPDGRLVSIFAYLLIASMHI
jgi:hypothetical protein